MKVKRSQSCSNLYKAKCNLKARTNSTYFTQDTDGNQETKENSMIQTVVHTVKKNTGEGQGCNSSHLPDVRTNRSQSVPSTTDRRYNAVTVRSSSFQSGQDLRSNHTSNSFRKTKGVDCSTAEQKVNQVADSDIADKISELFHNIITHYSKEDETGWLGKLKASTSSNAKDETNVNHTRAPDYNCKNTHKTDETTNINISQTSMSFEGGSYTSDECEETLPTKPMVRNICTVRGRKKKYMTKTAQLNGTMPTDEKHTVKLKGANYSETSESYENTSNPLVMDIHVKTSKKKTKEYVQLGQRESENHFQEPNPGNICNLKIGTAPDNEIGSENMTDICQNKRLMRQLSLDSCYSSLSSESLRYVEESAPIYDCRFQSTSQADCHGFPDQLINDSPNIPCGSVDSCLSQCCVSDDNFEQNSEILKSCASRGAADRDSSLVSGRNTIHGGSPEENDHSKTKESDCSMAWENRRDIVDDIFESQIADYVVHIGIEAEEKKIYIDVESGKLGETNDYLHKRYPMLYRNNIFEVIDGASGELPGKFAVKSNKKEFDNNRCFGDSYTRIKSGINIARPDPTKVRRTSEHEWENIEDHVHLEQGTLGAVCIDKKTQQLFGVTAGHIYTKEPGFQTGTIPTNCSLLKEGQNTKQYISDGYASFIGSTANRNGVDAAAIPLFKHVSQPDKIHPYFGSIPADDKHREKPSEDTELTVYTGSSSNLVGKLVQKRGAMTDYTVGTIIKAEGAYVRIKLGGKVTVIGDDCIIIGSDIEDKDFAELGDSGALVISDLNNSAEKYAYGIFFYILRRCNYKSKVTGKPYKKVFVCVRLDKALDVLNEHSGLQLDLYTPHKEECESSPKQEIKVQPCQMPTAGLPNSEHGQSCHQVEHGIPVNTESIMIDMKNQICIGPNMGRMVKFIKSPSLNRMQSMNFGSLLRRKNVKRSHSENRSRRCLSLPVDLKRYKYDDNKLFDSHIQKIVKSLSALDNYEIKI